MNPMKITFLIGNGFDLGVGLKTRYSDFVPYYLSLPDNDPDIIAFKSIIESDKETWADAELALGKLECVSKRIFERNVEYIYRGARNGNCNSTL